MDDIIKKLLEVVYNWHVINHGRTLEWIVRRYGMDLWDKLPHCNKMAYTSIEFKPVLQF